MNPTRHRRSRPTLSCLECRRRKLKCDRKEPCSRCIRVKSPCVYKGIGLCSSQPQSPHPHGMPAADAGIENGPSTASSLGLSDISTGITTERPHVPLPAPISKPVQDGPAHIKGTYTKGRLLGMSNWMTTFAQYNKLCAAVVKSSNNEADPLHDEAAFSEANNLLKRSKAMGKVIKAQGPSSTSSLEQIWQNMPTRETADVLVQNYFRTMELPFPIFHLPSFNAEYERSWSSPSDANPIFLSQLLLVMCIGVRFCQDTAPEHQLRQARQWASDAQWLISNPLYQDCLTISAIQTQCLLLLSRKVNPMGDGPTSIAAGSLLQSAIYMGLHRDPFYLPNVSVFEGEMRRRLWATVLELHVQSALDDGMTPLIACDGFDTQPPSNIDDEQIDATTTLAPSAMPSSRWTRSSLQIVLQQSLRIRLEVLRLVNDAFSHPSYDDTLSLSSKTADMCRVSDQSLQVLEFSQTGYVEPVYCRNLLNHLTRRFLLALHRPFAGGNTTDPRCYFSRKVCIDNALAILSPMPDKTFQRLLVTGQEQFKETSQHAAVTLCIETLVRLDEVKADQILAQTDKASHESLLDVLNQFLGLVEKRFEFQGLCVPQDGSGSD